MVERRRAVTTVAWTRLGSASAPVTIAWSKEGVLDEEGLCKEERGIVSKERSKQREGKEKEREGKEQTMLYQCQTESQRT